MSLAPEGYPFIAGLALIAIATWIVAIAGFGGGVTLVIAALFTALTIFNLWFFRDPKRLHPTGAGLVLAPAEGRVIDISEVGEPSFMGQQARKISIFLSIFDVHIQRAPVEGVVSHREYRPGAYKVAWADKASEENEQASVGITTEMGNVLVRQIAGLVARRIITYPSEGDRLERGQKIGLIRFGSRVDLFLPLDWEIICSVGDRTRVGSSVLARHPVEAVG